jgi:hypothetical protein
LPTSETSTYTYGDIVDVLPGNDDDCPDGLAVVIHTEDLPHVIKLWVLSSSEDCGIDQHGNPVASDFAGTPWDIYNPPSKSESPICWVVRTHNVMEVDKTK